MEIAAHQRMQRGLEQIQQAQEKETQKPQERVMKVATKKISKHTKPIEETVKEVIDNYETVKVSKNTEPIQERVQEVKKVETRDLDSYETMNILTNPNLKDAEIYESEEELFRRFAEEIEQDMAEQEQGKGAGQ